MARSGFEAPAGIARGQRTSRQRAPGVVCPAAASTQDTSDQQRCSLLVPTDMETSDAVVVQNSREIDAQGRPVAASDDTKQKHVKLDMAVICVMF